MSNSNPYPEGTDEMTRACASIVLTCVGYICWLSSPIAVWVALIGLGYMTIRIWRCLKWSHIKALLSKL